MLVNTCYLYQDDDINLLIKSKLAVNNFSQARFSYLLKGSGEHDSFEDVDGNLYLTFVTPAVGNNKLLNITYFFNKTIQPLEAEKDFYNDFFDEIKTQINHITSNPRIKIKILFPINIDIKHWLLGEIKLSQQGINYYTAEIYVHDPYGGGELRIEQRSVLANVLQIGLQKIQTGSQLNITYHQSSYFPRQDRSDFWSCGVIMVDDLFKRVKGESFSMVPHLLGALTLRIEDWRLIQDPKLTLSKDERDNFIKRVTGRNDNLEFATVTRSANSMLSPISSPPSTPTHRVNLYSMLPGNILAPQSPKSMQQGAQGSSALSSNMLFSEQQLIKLLNHDYSEFTKNDYWLCDKEGKTLLHFLVLYLIKNTAQFNENRSARILLQDPDLRKICLHRFSREIKCFALSQFSPEEIQNLKNLIKISSTKSKLDLNLLEKIQKLLHQCTDYSRTEFSEEELNFIKVFLESIDRQDLFAKFKSDNNLRSEYKSPLQLILENPSRFGLEGDLLKQSFEVNDTLLKLILGTAVQQYLDAPNDKQQREIIVGHAISQLCGIDVHHIFNADSSSTAKYLAHLSEFKGRSSADENLEGFEPYTFLLMRIYSMFTLYLTTIQSNSALKDHLDKIKKEIKRNIQTLLVIRYGRLIETIPDRKKLFGSLATGVKNSLVRLDIGEAIILYTGWETRGFLKSSAHAIYTRFRKTANNAYEVLIFNLGTGYKKWHRFSDASADRGVDGQPLPAIASLKSVYPYVVINMTNCTIDKEEIIRKYINELIEHSFPRESEDKMTQILYQSLVVETQTEALPSKAQMVGNCVLAAHDAARKDLLGDIFDILNEKEREHAASNVRPPGQKNYPNLIKSKFGWDSIHPLKSIDYYESMIRKSGEEFDLTKNSRKFINYMKAKHSPPRPKNTTVTRINLLNYINNFFADSTSDNSTKILILAGGSGFGKTTLALSFVEKIKTSDQDAMIYWIPGEKVREIYGNAIKYVFTTAHQLSPPENKFIEFFEKVIRSWTLIFDNLPASDLRHFIEHYIPKQGGQVIITTKFLHADDFTPTENMHCLTVGKLESGEAVELFNNITRQPQTDNVLELVKRLNYIPLAVSLAAKTITTNGISIENYLKMLGNPSGIFDSGSFVSSYPEDSLLAKIWSINLEEIRKLDIFALQILQLFVYLDCRCISRELIKKEWAEKAEKALDILSSYDFFETVDDHTYSIHPFTQDMTRDYNLRVDRIGSWPQKAKEFAEKHFSTLSTLSTSHLYQEIIAHLTSVRRYINNFAHENQSPDLNPSQSNISLLLRGGKLAMANENYGEAIVQFQEVVCFYKHKEINDENTREAQYNLAKIFYKLGRHQEAMIEYDSLLQKMAPPATSDFARIQRERATAEAITKNQLGLTHHGLGNYNEAIKYYEQSIMLLQKTFSDGSFSQAWPLNNIGLALCHLGRFDEAHSKLKEAKAIYKQNAQFSSLPQYQREIAVIRLNKGNLALLESNLAKANRQFAMAEAILLQNDSDSVLIFYVYLGLIETFEILGEYRKASKYIAKTKKLHFMNKESYNISGIANNVSNPQKNWKTHDYVFKVYNLDYYRDKLSFIKKIYGESHRETIGSLNNFLLHIIKGKNENGVESASKEFKKELELLEKLVTESVLKATIKPSNLEIINQNISYFKNYLKGT